MASVPPVAVAAPKLVVQSDSATFDVGGKSEVLIGREDPVSNIYPDIDLTPHGGEEGGVSRLHAKLFINGSQYLIEDQNSTNFTFVNRQKLAPKTPTPIKDGDEIRLGRVVLKFETA
jgi:pSer/pThr/pTyr-binding forkhead associated (FHA) protein